MIIKEKSFSYFNKKLNQAVVIKKVYQTKKAKEKAEKIQKEVEKEPR